MLRYLMNLICVNSQRVLLLLFLLAPVGFAQTLTTSTRGSILLAAGDKTATLVVEAGAWPGVRRAAGDLAEDVRAVTGLSPKVVQTLPASGEILLIATVGRSPLLDRLAGEHRIDLTPLQNQWEATISQTIEHPFPGIRSAFVIAGSDKRGAIFGVYDISREIGVSAWFWWADVPIPHKDALYLPAGRVFTPSPIVKYRGIFLNDEAPALSGMVHEKFGTFNSQFYAHVFILLLRLRANFLWPAMWANAFNEDDPDNPRLADEYGIVMGTSHHEPMMRAQQEWKRHGSGPWEYSKNGAVLGEFWRKGLERNKEYENMITIGMRGDGDLPMSETANIALLEQIVRDQRQIIADTYHRDPATVPQDWALYKEVQQYYEKGMRVPDDVTLLWCDDNWGNIRRLPTTEERKRGGGAGIYYHFDYVGDPRSYKWINTNAIPKVWEQMNLALHYGADRIWVVNVGDLKPMEFPTEFFLTLAWNPARWPKESIREFAELWASREFGAQYAPEIADIVSRYAKYNSRRKPELLEPSTYSQVNYREADTIIADFRAITTRAEQIYKKLPEEAQDAFYELVLYPANASAVVNELYVTVGKDRLYASQGRAITNQLARDARALFQMDAELSADYNHKLEGGKWNHMMDQTHIGYTSWNEPPVNSMPTVTEIELPTEAKMGVAVEGSELAWPGAPGEPALPTFDVFNQQSFYLDIFNRGQTPFTFTAAASAAWIKISESGGMVRQEKRVWISADWRHAPVGEGRGSVAISSSSGEKVLVKVAMFHPTAPAPEKLDGFVEADGYVSVEAVHYTRKVDEVRARWEKIDDLGRTLSAMSVFPVTAESLSPGQNAPCLEYKMYLFHVGRVGVEAIFDPTLNFVPGRGLRYAISFYDQKPQVVDVLQENTSEAWATSVKDNVREARSEQTISTPGYHTLKFWMVDPGVVLQKLVVDLGGVKPSYLGPRESYHVLP